MSQFIGFEVQVELKDGKLITGKIAKATNKGLTLNNVTFSDGGKSQAFKVRSSRLKDLKVLAVAKGRKTNNNYNNEKSYKQQISANNTSVNNNNNNNNTNSIDWKNDDVEKIKKTEDFDFQGNLNLFNKKDIFNQLKEYDNNNNITHCYDKDSYQNNEMIISNFEHDEDFFDDDDEYNFDDIDDPNYLPITKSINITHLLHSAVADKRSNSVSGISENDTNITDINDKDVLHNIENLILNETLSKNKKSQPNRQSINSSTSSLQLLPQQQLQSSLKDSKTSQTIPTATVIQLLEIERINFEKYGITSNSLIENFAINSSYFIKKNLLTFDNNKKKPLVVIMASDTGRSGLKSIILARYLVQTNRIDVVLLFLPSVMTFILSENLEISKHLDIFTKCGGRLVHNIPTVNNRNGPESNNSSHSSHSKIHQLKNILATLNNPPVDLIIDGLQGFDCNLIDDFDSDLTYELTELLSWCNYQISKYSTQCWSVDFPSGFDSSTGLKNFENAISNVNGIICSNWPVTSILTLKKSMNLLKRIVLIDSGIPSNVYLEKNSFKKFQTVEDLFLTEGSKMIEF
ncbi:hypothetical protein NCAS_0G03260 [Naumovozyma castellii]|uniref:Enhancer of mRNA-decapping protein 3 n=1 Tax=Naumovozyma castellii TaxID=27288 RepID=G0VIH8_NAUCA|nr:hypothetical protein NCAS_0G03260 [Naumovozyma castellii CBS 4309]CCC71213.1 hypothetical protein NCAS_0G03260 [Naumovozyma castellii CBS 4309]